MTDSTTQHAAVICPHCAYPCTLRVSPHAHQAQALTCTNCPYSLSFRHLRKAANLRFELKSFLKSLRDNPTYPSGATHVAYLVDLIKQGLVSPVTDSDPPAYSLSNEALAVCHMGTTLHDVQPEPKTPPS